MAKRKTASSVQRTPVTETSARRWSTALPQPPASSVEVGPIDPEKTRIARAIEKREGRGRGRQAGMLVYNAPFGGRSQFGSGYLDAYRSSYADGLGQSWSGYGDVPTFLQMLNEKNGGLIAWPVTLREKYEWYRYYGRCIYLSNSDLGLVLMADGTERDIRDVRIGDEVVTGLGTVRPVREKFERRFADDRATTIKAWCIQNHLKTTHHHPYWVLRREKVWENECRKHKKPKFEPEWVHAENVRPGDYVLLPPLPADQNSGITVSQAIVLGYYAAEGSLVKGNRCIGTTSDANEKKAAGWKWRQHKQAVPVGVSFSFSINEELTVAQSLMSAIKAAFGVKARLARRRGNAIEIVANGRGIADFCLKHCGEYSDRKRLSPDLMRANNEARRAFLLAYAEGDGHQCDERTSNKGKVIIGTASAALGSQVQLLAVSCGVMCRHASYDRPQNSGFSSATKQIHITIPSWSANTLVGGSSRWSRHSGPDEQHGALFVGGYAAFKVREVSFTQENATVYNLEVDAEGDEKSYVCNGMVTHNTDAYVGRALELCTDLPMSKITLRMPNLASEGGKGKQQEILEFFQHMCDKIDLFEVLHSALWEVNLIGQALMFHEWDDKAKMWSEVTFLPPEEVGVFEIPFSRMKRVEYRPEKLIQLINMFKDNPGALAAASPLQREVYENIPQEIKKMVQEQGAIIMDSDPMTGSFTYVMTRRRSPYLDLGASLVERVLVPLLQRECYRYTQLGLASRNMTPKNIVTANMLPGDKLSQLRNEVDMSYWDPEYTIVANYDINWQQVGTENRLLDLSREYEPINEQIFAGLGVTKELLTGEASFSGSKITVEILNTMFLLGRTLLTEYVEKQLFIPVCEAHKWYRVTKGGFKKYWYPHLAFNRLTIRDNAEVFDSLFTLYQKGSLPVQVIYELFGLDPEAMEEGIKKDLFTASDSTFNEMVQAVNGEVGRQLVDKSDVLPRIRNYLGLKEVEPPAEEGEEGFGGFSGKK